MQHTPPRRRRVHESVFDVRKLRERDYAFVDDGSTSVEIEEPSLARDFWELVTKSSPGLVDPGTGRVVEMTLDEVERRAVEAHDKERRLACRYFELTDRLENIEERVAKPDPRFGSYNHTVLQSNKVFIEWEYADAEATQLTELWGAYRDDRLARLEQAIAMQPGLRTTATREQRYARSVWIKEAWTPSDALFYQLRQEADELRSGLQLSYWYYMQTVQAESSGRPLFSLNEIGPTGEILGEDPNHRPPIKASLLKRLELVELVL